MPASNLLAIEDTLTAQLDSMDWDGSTASCAKFARELRGSSVSDTDKIIRRVLSRLRRKRQFGSMATVADAALQAGHTAGQIRRQYAQALIDSGHLSAARSVLETMVQDPKTLAAERMEALGLLGRIHKQSFVNAGDADDALRSADLLAAIDRYEEVYRSAPDEFLWHGINVVALRARAGEVAVSQRHARDILTVLARREQESTEASLPAWDVATRLEAFVALHELGQAEQTAIEYVRCEGADSFELASTCRQLEEIWRLGEQDELGRRILPILRAALLRQRVVSLPIKVDVARSDADQIKTNLEKRFSEDKSLPFVWYRTGLERCKGIARIEKSGRGLGTGWLVRSEDFFPKDGTKRMLLLTNAHVVATPAERAKATRVRPALASEVQINFQWFKISVGVESIRWCSPIEEFDASFLELRGLPDGAEALSLSAAPIAMATPAPRMYIIGHPGGRDLEFSLYDNTLVGADARKLHYRTPTEGGSSGSPVFEPDNWQVVGLHHSGKSAMARLDDPGQTYEANEGISIHAIREAARREA